MRSFNGHHMANFKGSHSISVSPREQIEIYAASTQVLTLSGDAEKIVPKLDEKGRLQYDDDNKLVTKTTKYSVILKTGTLIDLKAVFHNFVSLRVTSPSPTVKFGLLLKTTARQIEEPHDPSKPSLFATLEGKEDTQLRKMINEVTGYRSRVKRDPPPLKGTSMEPEDMPFQGYVLDDDDRDIFDPEPPQDAQIPQASDPAVQPQGIEQPVPEAQPSPPANEPQTNDKG